jgi:hypothetical protein
MNGKFWSKIAISAVIFGLAVYAFNSLSHSPDAVKILLPPVQSSATAKELLGSVLLARSEVAVQEQGHLARAAFAIDNRSSHNLKNIEVLCTLFDERGVEQGRDKWVIYDTIKAHSNGVFYSTSKKYVSNRACASLCQIVDLEKTTAPLIAIHRENAMDHNGGHQKTPDAVHGGMQH